MFVHISSLNLEIHQSVSTYGSKMSCCLSLQGRLNELMSQIRMQNHFGAVRSEERYSVDADLLREIKQVRRPICSVCLIDCMIAWWWYTELTRALSVLYFFAFQHLKQQQEGLSHLISVIKDDLEDIKLIEHGLGDSGHLRGGILSWVNLTQHNLATKRTFVLVFEQPPWGR